MPRITNHELLNRIIVATDQNRIDWQPTAKPREFTASFGGKWTLALFQAVSIIMLDVKDSGGEIIVRITSQEDARIADLYEMARRHALKIDEALTDLLNEIDKPPK
jgi:hypothetical protein